MITPNRKRGESTSGLNSSYAAPTELRRCGLSTVIPINTHHARRSGPCWDLGALNGVVRPLLGKCLIHGHFLLFHNRWGLLKYYIPTGFPPGYTALGSSLYEVQAIPIPARMTVRESAVRRTSNNVARLAKKRDSSVSENDSLYLNHIDVAQMPHYEELIRRC